MGHSFVWIGQKAFRFHHVLHKNNQEVIAEFFHLKNGVVVMSFSS